MAPHADDDDNNGRGDSDAEHDVTTGVASQEVPEDLGDHHERLLSELDGLYWYCNGAAKLLISALFLPPVTICACLI